ncbi:MAG: DNA polymerase III subunit delta [Lachnospiraceae bacterium]|nr:DNA polymerase III subunit delta [Lachnospiraceae bacterium]
MADFDAIIGQEQLKERMKATAESGQCSHAYLLVGERRSGRTMLAKAFAKAILCEGEGRKPCNCCLSCLQVEEGSHPDLVYVTHEKPNSIGVDDIRQGVNEDIILKPYRGTKKVYIVEEAEKMTAQAQNALLKTMEEPPSYAVILLIATTADAMLQTILSRSVLLPIHPVPDEIIRRYLMTEKHIPDYRADVICAFARGNVGRAIDIISGESFEQNKTEAVAILKSLSDADYGKIYQDSVKLGKVIKEKKENNEENRSYLSDLLDFFLVWFRDALVYKSTGRSEGLIFREEIQYIKKVSGDISYEGFEDIFRAIEKAKKMIRSNVNIETVSDLLLMSFKDCRKER